MLKSIMSDSFGAMRASMSHGMHREKDKHGLVLLKPDWPAPASIHAFMTTKQGGCSVGPYAGLNLGHHVGDVPEHVAANRALLAHHLPQAPVYLNQVHGVACLQLEAKDYVANLVHPPTADASVSVVLHQVCGILTADCLPVLFCTKDGRAVGAAHAGWKGLCAGVLERTIDAMLQAHGQAQTSDVLVWMGAAIGPDTFEVGRDVYDAFVSHNAANATAFVTLSERGKYLADIYALARLRLIAKGVPSDAVYGGDACTVLDRDDFYSYRRDAGQTGRMFTGIWRSDPTTRP